MDERSDEGLGRVGDDRVPSVSDQALQRPVRLLPGIGPRWAETLERLGIRRLYHLLFHLPRDYEVIEPSVRIAELQPRTTVAVVGTVEEVEARQTANGLYMVGVLVRQGDDYLRGIWFNQPYQKQQVSYGQQVCLTGRPRFRGLRWEMSHPRLQVMDTDDAGQTVRQVRPIYPLTSGLKQHQLRRWIRYALDHYAQYLQEVLPESIRELRALPDIVQAVRAVHLGHDPAEREAAWNRLRYQELLLLQLALAWQRSRRITAAAPALPLTARIESRIRRLLPFELTEQQDRAVQEIAKDMGADEPMYRLLQGDVGCGKTIVSAFAMLLAIAHGCQTALMAPTELLALQHFEVFQDLLRKSRVRMAPLVGSLSAAARGDTLARLAAGELDLVIGTHSLLGPSVVFHKPGLLVVDEQHKFGVQQRARLQGTDLQPHYLTMSATPIPRTLARSLFGELQVSSIEQLPPGRQPVHTYVARDAGQWDKWWDFFRGKIAAGRQGFVVSPFVDSGEDFERQAVEQLLEQLMHGQLEGLRLDLVHGRLSADARNRAMEAFRRGETQVLVATSLIEVGIDVPNATVMSVLHAERFGLAQLHQLRGRVGRGRFPGFVCLYSQSDDQAVENRLNRFAQTESGFEVAELDLALRGPGELLGLRQHGAPPLLVADLVRDRELLETARHDAQLLLKQDPDLQSQELERLRTMLQRRYGELLREADSD